MTSGVDIIRDTVPQRGQTGNGTIGTTADQLSGATIGRKLYTGVLIKADASNTDTIYVGFSDDVSSSKGYKLGAGDVVPLSVESVDEVWIIGGAASQTYSWFGM